MKDYREKICDICGNLFVQNSPVQKRCSPECMRQGELLKNRDRYRKNKKRSNEQRKRWRENNRERDRETARRYRARQTDEQQERHREIVRQSYNDLKKAGKCKKCGEQLARPSSSQLCGFCEEELDNAGSVAGSAIVHS